MSSEVKSALAMLSLLLLLFCAIVNVLSTPDMNFESCSPGDDVCITNMMKAAFPELLNPNPEIGAEELDPMHHDVVEGNLSILKFKLFNTTVTGFRSCEVQNAKFNVEDEKMEMELMCPSFALYGLYDIKGRLIILPVEGNGDYRIDTKKYQLFVDMFFKTVNKDGKKYRNIKSFAVKGEPLERVSYDFRNLFNGQQDLAEAVLKFANENWKEVAHELQEPVFMANFKKIIKNVNKYLKAMAN